MGQLFYIPPAPRPSRLQAQNRIDHFASQARDRLRALRASPTSFRKLQRLLDQLRAELPD